MKRLRMSVLTAVGFLAVFGVGLLGPFTPPAYPSIPDLTWEAIEVVDAPVSDVPSGNGTAIVAFEGSWFISYVKAGQIYVARRGPNGWLPPTAMTQSPAVPSDPHLAEGDGALHLVWQDERSGHPEVWTRRHDGGNWTPELALTDDSTPSSSPSVAGLIYSARVVWQEGEGTSARIRSRRYTDGAWGASDLVSLGSAAATEPTISGSLSDALMGFYYVAWADARHGETEIYCREGESSWFTETRLTNLPGACRHPSIANESCCSDYMVAAPLTAFAYTPSGGVTEVWSATTTVDPPDVSQISPSDGIPSTRPCASGNEFWISGCMFGGPFARYWVSWIDETAPGAGSVSLVRTLESGVPIGSDLLATNAVGRGQVGGGELTPDGVMIAWCELRNGVPTLLARRGWVPACSELGLRAPAALLLTPEGTPANELQQIDVCTQEDWPIGGMIYNLSFSSNLVDDLTWDPLQEYPDIAEETNAEGKVTFSIRGGGCSHAGDANVLCEFSGPVSATWHGAKSPDVDGDCVVRLDDLLYVQSRLGSSEFCADLDGSGLVDAADVAIVQATMGEHCSNVTAAGEAAVPVSLQLLASPNPTRGSASIRLAGTEGEAALLRIVAVSGRVVWSRAAVVDRAAATWDWDGHDAEGRPLASGLYALLATCGTRTVRSSLLVLR